MSNELFTQQYVRSFIQRCYNGEEESDKSDAIEDDEPSDTSRRKNDNSDDPIEDVTPQRENRSRIIDDEELLRIVEEEETKQLDMIDYIEGRDEDDGFFATNEQDESIRVYEYGTKGISIERMILE